LRGKSVPSQQQRNKEGGQRQLIRYRIYVEEH
jgi:hypothetical protein